MKTYIIKRDYKYSNKEGPWWTWREVCDECGDVVYELNDIITLQEPDTSSKDYCLQCLSKNYENM